MNPAIQFIYESILGYSMPLSQPFWSRPVAKLTGYHIFYFGGRNERCKAILTPTKQKVVIEWGYGEISIVE